MRARFSRWWSAGAANSTENLERLAGMTTPPEREYLADYARRLYTGAGEIVDLGSWLGSLTIPLLIGLRENPAAAESNATLHAYDLFEWAEWMDPYQKKAGFQKRLRPGDSFLPEFIRRVSPFDPEKRMVIHAGDLGRLGWCGRPIELLVIDVMKSWELANVVVKDFFPSLIPGRSYVFHQDFCHYYTTWIHLLHYRFRDHFETVASLPESAGMVFRYSRPFEPASLRRAYSFADFSDADVDQAFAFSLQQVAPEQLGRRQAVMAAKIMACLQQQAPEKAKRELDRLAAQGTAMEGELKIVQELVAKAEP